jgi:hypothetical protein
MGPSYVHRRAVEFLQFRGPRAFDDDKIKVSYAVMPDRRFSVEIVPLSFALTEVGDQRVE